MIKNYFSNKSQEGFYLQKSDLAKNSWRYRFLSVLLPMFFLLIGELANAQVSINETFDGTTTPTGWTYTGFSRSTVVPCTGAGSIRKNQYSGATTGSATTPTWTSNGQNLTIAFDYKLLNWTSGTPTVATPNTPAWGSIITEVSIDGGTTYSITAGTIDATTHVVSTTCANVSYSVPGASLPSGNSTKVRFRLTFAGSTPDYYVYMDNVVVNQVALTPPNCATTLLPADAATGVARNPTLSWAAATGGATSYDVYLGTSSPATFVGNTASTSYTPSVLAASTLYYYKVVAKNANGDAVGCTEQSFTTGTSLNYCPSVPTSKDGSGITNVTLAGTSLPITGAATYSNQTATVIDIYGGTTVASAVTLATGYTYRTVIWIDLNDNGIFDAAELVYNAVSLSANPTTLDTSFPLSGSAAAGQHRMRIVAIDDETATPNPCYSGSYGVTVDLTVNIIAASLCSGTPEAGAVSRSTTSACSGGAIAPITVTGMTSGVSGLEFQWEQSTDAGANYVNAVGGSGATTSAYTPPVFAGSDIQYRLKVTCSTSGLSDFSDVSTVTGPMAPTTQASAISVASGLSSATISWTNGNGNRRHVVVNTTNSFTDPVGTADVATAATAYAGTGEQIVFNGTGNSVTVTGLTNGTYYVRVYENFRCTGTPNTNYYNVTTATDNPVSFVIEGNDVCADAITVECDDVITTSLVGSTNENQPVCGISGVTTQNSAGIWYKFIGTGGDITVSTGLSSTNVDTRLAVFSGACGSLTCIGGNDDLASGNYRSEVLFSSTVDTEYYILLYSYSATTPTASITLSVTCAAPCAPATLNDECSAPVAVTIGTPLMSNNTCSSPSAGVAFPSAGSSFGTYYDSWYSFNSGSNTALSVSALSEAPTAVGFALYTGVCGTLTQVTGSSTLTGAKINLTNIVANTDYLVRVFADSPGERGDFTLLVELPRPTILAADCGTTKQEVAYESIDAQSFASAEEYEFMIVNGAFSATVVSPDASVFFSEFAGFQYGTTYDVSVRAKFAGVFGEYGPTCEVSTTATPTTEMQYLCGQTMPQINSKVYFKFVPLATNYRYEVTNNTTSAVVTTESTSRFFYMNNLSNFSYATVYSVRAQVEIDGVFQPYGDPCNITTPASSTQLRAAFCGITLSATTNNLFANYVAGATAYRFRATNGATVQEYTTTDDVPKFSLSMLPEVLFNTAYTIDVASQVGGVWSPYGASCVVTTPAGAPLTKLRDAFCGITVSALNSNLFANYVNSATAYKFRVTQGAMVEEIETVDPRMTLTMLSTTPLLGTTYQVEVASYVNSAWTAYGDICSVTTPASAPLTKLRDAYCGITLNAVNSNIYAKAAAGATAYRFKANDGVSEEVYETSGLLFRLTYLTTMVPQDGTTYSISVSYNKNGMWSDYGDICTVTTPIVVARQAESENLSAQSFEKLEVKAYPNPFTNNFSIGLNLVTDQKTEIYVFDMTGKLVERTILDANQIERSGIGSQLSSGIYNVQIVQGQEVHNLKVIKK